MQPSSDDSESNASIGNRSNASSKYMIIISGKATNAEGETQSTSGIGFGSDRNEALREAIDNLQKRLPTWDEHTHGFVLVSEKQIDLYG